MTILLFALSIIPSIILLVIIRKQNNYSYHPKSLIFKLVLFGALSIIPTILCETGIGAIFNALIKNDDVYLFLTSFIGIALVEESFKYLVLFLVVKRNDKYFKTYYDGIIYSVSVAMGFAMIENLLYVFMYSEEGIFTALLRAATPGHFFLSIIMGILFSEAKKYEYYDSKKYSRFLVLSILIPTIVHGLFDYCLLLGNTIFYIIFIILLIGLYIFAFITIKKKSKEIYFI